MKVHMNIIADWLLQMIVPSEPTEEIVYMKGLNKCVTIRDSQI